MAPDQVARLGQWRVVDAEEKYRRGAERANQQGVPHKIGDSDDGQHPDGTAEKTPDTVPQRKWLGGAPERYPIAAGQSDEAVAERLTDITRCGQQPLLQLMWSLVTLVMFRFRGMSFVVTSFRWRPVVLRSGERIESGILHQDCRRHGELNTIPRRGVID